MNFLKSSNTNMANTEPKFVPDADSPQFKNAQAIEEGSPVSPTFDNVPRRTSGNAGPAFGEPGFKYDMFGTERPHGIQDQEIPVNRDRRMSKEWDASKVPPSRFQKRAGSIHATPASRDGHIERNDRSALFDKLAKGKKGERRKSQS